MKEKRNLTFRRHEEPNDRNAVASGRRRGSQIVLERAIKNWNVNYQLSRTGSRRC
jgi:hypothetical protein